MDTRYDWLATELNSLGLRGWNSAVGNSLSYDSQKNGAVDLPLNHAVSIKGGGQTNDLAAAVLKGLPVENENGLVGLMGGKWSGEQMVAGMSSNELLKLGPWNGTDLKTASSGDVSTNANIGGTSGSKDANWGQLPIRQDTAWDNATSVGKFSDPVVGSSLSASMPNDGTDIWRSTLPSSDLPVGTASLDQIKLNGPMIWNNARHVSVPSDPRAQHILSSATAGAVLPSSWDGSNTKMWGLPRTPVENTPSLPLSDVLHHLSMANKFTTSSEADFGVWSHSSSTVPSQQPPIDNGTAIWGSPPSLGGDTTVTSAANRQPTTPALPFSIDLTVPPPPLPKSVICPPASAWNPTAQMVCCFGTFYITS